MNNDNEYDEELEAFGEFFDGPSVQRERCAVAAWRRKSLRRELLGTGPAVSLGNDEAIPLLAEAMRKAVDESSYEALLRRVRAA